ncbi:hypothetical protein [Bradyrhizobium sp. th.b2]|uniref:hypothetical protein n=1 Tax=Bradyrhizobium sp. th-b2 TaxID=172088 RepID=UPI00040E2E96|nr:hypothetical protein [Bradyrhizobium sp. th.b2]
MTQKITNISIVRAGPIAFTAVKSESEGARSNIKFKMVFGDTVLADMGEEAARFFISRVQEAFAIERGDEWTRLPTYAAVEADRQKVAARNATSN